MLADVCGALGFVLERHKVVTPKLPRARADTHDLLHQTLERACGERHTTVGDAHAERVSILVHCLHRVAPFVILHANAFSGQPASQHCKDAMGVLMQRNAKLFKRF